MATALHIDYPWTKKPLIVSAPMRLIALAPLAVAVSRAGGLGFIGAGTDLRDLENELHRAKTLMSETPIAPMTEGILPIGVGFINWGADLDIALEVVAKSIPSAVWFFAPRENRDLVRWTMKVREATSGKTKIWIQVGSVKDAVDVANLCEPDVLVLQGLDAGGHGLNRGAGIISLLPEVSDAMKAAGHGKISIIAAGGIVEGRGVAACLTLGADGVAMGTRFLASKEATIAKGYQDDVLRSSDGGMNTIRSRVYDTLRGTTGWPNHYGGRGIINDSFLDAKDGLVTDEMRQKHNQALTLGDAGWGKHGRLTAYAGSGLGLVRQVVRAEDIVNDVRVHAMRIFKTNARASL